MTSEHPRSVEDIFQNYLRRKQGLIRALTEDSNELFKACDPERDNQCLYGEPNGTWMVDLPAEEVPPELPEPCLGINFARDGLQKKDWMALVAVHSDAWLLSVAFYYAAKLDSHERMALFSRINSMPTLFEIVTGKASSSQVPGAPSGEGRPLRPNRQVLDYPLYGGLVFTQGPKTGTSGRLLSYEDISPALKGREAEMFWPDDETWYQVTIISVNIRQRSARIQYVTGEVEDLNLDEIVQEGHMALL